MKKELKIGNQRKKKERKNFPSKGNGQLSSAVGEGMGGDKENLSENLNLCLIYLSRMSLS